MGFLPDWNLERGPAAEDVVGEGRKVASRNEHCFGEYRIWPPFITRDKAIESNREIAYTGAPKLWPQIPSVPSDFVRKEIISPLGRDWIYELSLVR